eukprot:TRINITY_DN8987_c0_g1_i2.p1 TRINITY_DN8987_c0_g1~~TRINITY_DN8987_c0_g1_i2.p1  ORF type:complete len:107 (+),score=17.19 TRINITY_DN8987_c0_g1_i2:29-322(+)
MGEEISCAQMSSESDHTQNNSITIRTWNGKHFSVGFVGDKTFQQVKQEIHAQGGFPAESQRIIYDGIQVEENRTLSDYNVQPGATLHSVIRLSGKNQ